jgi:predicted ferric reductase
MAFLKLNLGRLLVIIFFIFNAVVWLTASVGEPALLVTFSHWHGANILLSMTLVFLLSTKSQVIYQWFGGVKQAIATQRLLTILSLGFVYLHAFISSLLRSELFLGGAFNITALLGLSTYMGIGLLLLLLLVRASRLTQQSFLHGVMMILFGVGTYHAFVSSSYPLLNVSLLGLWMSGVVFTGLFAMMIPLVKFIVKLFCFKPFPQKTTNKKSSIY